MWEMGWLGTETVAAFSGPARCPADAVSIHAKLFSNERVKLPVISVLNGTFLKTLVSFGSSANGLNLYPGPGCILIASRCTGVLFEDMESGVHIEVAFPLFRHTWSSHSSHPVSCPEMSCAEGGDSAVGVPRISPFF